MTRVSANWGQRQTCGGRDPQAGFVFLAERDSTRLQRPDHLREGEAVQLTDLIPSPSHHEAVLGRQPFLEVVPQRCLVQKALARVLQDV